MCKHFRNVCFKKKKIYASILSPPTPLSLPWPFLSLYFCLAFSVVGLWVTCYIGITGEDDSITCHMILVMVVVIPWWLIAWLALFRLSTDESDSGYLHLTSWNKSWMPPVLLGYWARIFFLAFAEGRNHLQHRMHDVKSLRTSNFSI
jgi:hypothetical protein